MTAFHTIDPVFDRSSAVLILGTIPSPKSREHGFYYMHPQNRFWPVLGAVLGEDIPSDIEGKKALLLRRRVALWDVLESCEIAGAADATIRREVPNDLTRITDACHLRAVFTTGTTAAQLYKKYGEPQTGLRAVCLPSTSPANCRYHTSASLTAAYAIITDFLPATR